MVFIDLYDFATYFYSSIIFSEFQNHLSDLGDTVLVCWMLFYSMPRAVLIFSDLILFSYQLSLSGVVCVINKLSSSYTINVYTAC